jgi:hypothetical protein
MPDPDPLGRLFEIADYLLGAVADAADEHSHPLPDRRQVGEGTLAWDCPMVSVNLVSIFRGQPGGELQAPLRASDTWTAELGVWIIRCATMPNDQGDLPSAEAVTASAGPLLRDAVLLSAGIMPALFELSRTCTAVAVRRVFPQGPEGGLAGHLLGLEVTL